MLVRRLGWMHLAPLWMMAAIVGCGTGEYDQRLDKRIGELRAAAAAQPKEEKTDEAASDPNAQNATNSEADEAAAAEAAADAAEAEADRAAEEESATEAAPEATNEEAAGGEENPPDDAADENAEEDK